jgi:hypothetical protein
LISRPFVATCHRSRRAVDAPGDGDAQDGGGVAHADSSGGERHDGLGGLLHGVAVGVAGALSRFTRLLDGAAGDLCQKFR